MVLCIYVKKMVIVKEKGCQWQPFYKDSKGFFDYRPVVQPLAQVGLAVPLPAPFAVLSSV
jgi:hypothetical protein